MKFIIGFGFVSILDNKMRMLTVKYVIMGKRLTSLKFIHNTSIGTIIRQVCEAQKSGRQKRDFVCNTDQIMYRGKEEK